MTNPRLIYLFLIFLGGFWREPGKEKGKGEEFLEGYWREEKGGQERHGFIRINVERREDRSNTKSKLNYIDNNRVKM